MKKQISISNNVIPGSITSLKVAENRVRQIDFMPINLKLMIEDSRFWTNDLLKSTEQQYRRFLVLHIMFPSDDLVPTKLIDAYWHQHILDTKKYERDCEFLFGEFLHHDPYFGINGDDDRLMNEKVFAWTQSLWEMVFGEVLNGEANPCKSTDCR
jgi:hypothetical protein